MADSGGLLGNPDMQMQIAMGLLANGDRNLAGQGGIGHALQGAVQDYYGQQQAKQQLQQGQLQNAMAMQKMQMMQQAMGQYLGSQGQGGQPPQGGPPPQMPQGGPPPQMQAPQGLMGQPPQMPQGLAPQSPDQMRSQPIGGINPNYYRAMALINGKDPLSADKEIQDRQYAEAQQQYAPALTRLQDVIKSDNPTKAVSADPNLRAAWGANAPALGRDPVKDFNDTNVRTVLKYAHNQLAASIHAPTLEEVAQAQQGQDPVTGSRYEVDPTTGKRTYAPVGPNVLTAQQKIEDAQKERQMASDYVKVIDPATHQPVLMPKEKAGGMQPYNESEYLSGKFTPQMSGLMAALAERGVSLPTGMRSQPQQVALYQGLIDKNPGKSSDEIADAVRSGKISLAGDTRAEQAAGATAGKVSYAENELRQSIPLALDASSKVDRGKFVPLNKLMQMANSSISDPDLLDFKIKHQSVMNAYDMLAARSGTDVGKRAAAHSLVDSATSPEGYAKAMKAFEQESLTAGKAGRAAMDQMSGKMPVGSSAGAHPADIQAILSQYKH